VTEGDDFTLPAWTLVAIRRLFWCWLALASTTLAIRVALLDVARARAVAIDRDDWDYEDEVAKARPADAAGRDLEVLGAGCLLLTGAAVVEALARARFAPAAALTGAGVALSLAANPAIARIAGESAHTARTLGIAAPIAT
jgi:hypothetical protein